MANVDKDRKKTKTTGKTRTIPALVGLNIITLALLISLKGYFSDTSISAIQIVIIELTLLPSLVTPLSLIIVIVILLIATYTGPPFFGLTHLLVSWIITFSVFIVQRRQTITTHEIDELLKLEMQLSTHGHTINEVEEKILEFLKTNEIAHIYSISSTMGVDQKLLIQVAKKMIKEGKIQCLITMDNQKLIPLTVLKENILKELEAGENPSVTELSKKLGVEDKKLINALVSLVKTGQFENYFRKYS